MGMFQYIRNLQDKMLFYPEKLEPDYSFHFSRPHEEVFLKAEDGTRLHGLLFPKKDTDKVILYFHGNAGSLRSWGEISELFAPYPYSFLIIDYRGYGKSEGNINSEEVLVQDASVFYNYLINTYKPEHIIIYGRSLGTVPASFLLSQKEVSFGILETPLYDYASIAKRFVPLAPTFLLKYKFPIHQWLKKAKSPVHIFHGTSDEVIPYDLSLRLKSVLKPEDTFTTIEGGGHNNLSLFSEFREGIDKLFKK